MKKKLCTLILVLSSVLLFTQCKKTTEFQSDPLSDYVNLQVGKYIIYQLDSTIKIPFNDTGFTTHTYQAKDIVEQAMTDNLGRPSWRVSRYLRDTASTSEQDWQANLTYMVTPTRETIEVTENNLRIQKLNLPITENFSWYGNKYLEYGDPFSADYNFDNDNAMGIWQFFYSSVGTSEIIQNKQYDSVITVQQVDQRVNYPVVVDTAYGSMDYSVEKYAKHIGLVYKELTMIEYQGANNIFPNGYKEGFGIKMSIIDHN